VSSPGLVKGEVREDRSGSSSIAAMIGGPVQPVTAAKQTLIMIRPGAPPAPSGRLVALSRKCRDPRGHAYVRTYVGWPPVLLSSEPLTARLVAAPGRWAVEQAGSCG
jgi:hypothetical protein